MPMDPLETLQRELASALEEISRATMPFGKYGPQFHPPHGIPLYDLPVEYLLWFKQKGFPKGKLGQHLTLICQIKVDGAEAIFDPIRRANGGPTQLRTKRKTSWTSRDEEK